MIGKWGDSKEPSGYFSIDTVSGTNGRHYLVETVSADKEKKIFTTNRFSAVLLRISGGYYLDCWVDNEQQFSLMGKGYESWLVARHFIVQLTFPAADSIELRAPDPETLVKLIDQKKILLHYATLKKDDYLILDKPALLQKAFAESKKYPSLYKEKNMLHRLE